MCFKIRYALLQAVLGTLLLSSCGALKNNPRHQLTDGYYNLREGKLKPATVYVHNTDDSLTLYVNNKIREAPLMEEAQLVKQSFDLDIVTFAFKYRPAASNSPRQLTADFNGNVYMGYRIDRFYRKVEHSPAGIHKTIRHRALTAGVFGGLGSTSVTPWTTNYQTTDEYNAPILSRGLAFMAGLNSLTVGVGVGWDSITDRDKAIWIYQNKPWFGVVIGLSIN